jgi:hypothetical protein
MAPLDDATATALFVEAARKGEVGWLELGDGRTQPVWWACGDQTLALVTGGLEQPDPGLVDGVTVTALARSKDKGSRLVTVTCEVRELRPGSSDWNDAAQQLQPKRLNSPDGAAAADRWQRECRIWLLTPTGRVLEAPGAMSADAHRHEPQPTPATTIGKLPLMIGRRPRRR